MTNKIYCPGLGEIDHSNFSTIDQSINGIFKVGESGVVKILQILEKKIDLIVFTEKTLLQLHSESGYSVFYPISDVKIKKPIKALLMDLDGTTVNSENFWKWVIEKTMVVLSQQPNFQLNEFDNVYLSGHSVTEHLSHCLLKYCPNKSIKQAKKIYNEITLNELDKIKKGIGRKDAFLPRKGLKEFLKELKARNIKIGLVSGGSLEKVIIQINACFKSIDLGNPEDFYDVIITGGTPCQRGCFGTLGEINTKPHPWLYIEAAHIGLGLDYSMRNSIVCIEDSFCGVISSRLAGFSTIGLEGGNILTSGFPELLSYYCKNYDSILNYIF